MVYLLAPRWAEAPAPLDAPRLPIMVAGVVFNRGRRTASISPMSGPT
jgi:hypothetical protein